MQVSSGDKIDQTCTFMTGGCLLSQGITSSMVSSSGCKWSGTRF